MQYGVTALTHHNHAGLHFVRHVNDLFRRVSEGNFRLEFDLLFLGAFAHWTKVTIEAITLVIEHRGWSSALSAGSGGRMPSCLCSTSLRRYRAAGSDRRECMAGQMNSILMSQCVVDGLLLKLARD